MQRVSPQYRYTYTYRYTYRYAYTYAYTYTYTAAGLPSLQLRSALAAAKWESRLLKGLADAVNEEDPGRDRTRRRRSSPRLVMVEAMPGLNTVEKMGKTLDPLSRARALITTCTLPTPVPTCPLRATRSTRTCETKHAHACVLTKSQCAVGVNGTRLCLLLLPSQTPASPVVYHFIDIVLS